METPTQIAPVSATHSFEPLFSMSLENGACFQRVPMPVRPLGCTAGIPRRACISFLACWSSVWWASRLQTRSRSWTCPASRPLRCLTLSLPRLLAIFPATQRKAVPGVLIGRNAVSIGISKDKGAAERTIIRWLDDGSAFRFQFGMQRIDLIAVDPERHPPSQSVTPHPGCGASSRFTLASLSAKGIVLVSKSTKSGVLKRSSIVKPNNSV